MNQPPAGYCWDISDGNNERGTYHAPGPRGEGRNEESQASEGGIPSAYELSRAYQKRYGFQLPQVVPQHTASSDFRHSMPTHDGSQSHPTTIQPSDLRPLVPTGSVYAANGTPTSIRNHHQTPSESQRSGLIVTPSGMGNSYPHDSRPAYHGQAGSGYRQSSFGQPPGPSLTPTQFSSSALPARPQSMGQPHTSNKPSQEVAYGPQPSAGFTRCLNSRGMVVYDAERLFDAHLRLAMEREEREAASRGSMGK